MNHRVVQLHPLVSTAVCALAATVVLAVPIAGCGSDEAGAPADATGAAATAPNESEIVDRVRASTVEVNADDGDFHSHGSGVVVDAARNLVLTSGHVVDAARNLKITIGEDAVVKGRVVARAQCEDLALIALFPEQKGLIELPMGDSDSVAAGDPVFALSYSGLAKTKDGKEKLAITQGRVSVTGATTRLTNLLPEFPSLIVHQAPLTHTSTGSPLLDAEGQWIGLNLVMPERHAAEGPAGMYYAVPTNRIRELMNELSPGETSFFAGWEKYHACHRRMGRLAQAQQVADHDLSGAKPRHAKRQRH